MLDKILHCPASKHLHSSNFTNQNPNRSPTLTTPQEIIVTNGATFTLIRTSNGLLTESLYLNRDDQWKSQFERIEKFKRISTPTLVAGNPGYQNYYHWTYQIWSSILYALHQIQDSESLTVLGPPLNSWRRRYIELLGPRIQYIESMPNCGYFLDAAYWCDAMHGSYSFKPSTKMLNIFEEFGANFIQNTPSRIYISRKDTQLRGVNNEDEVERIVSKRGFTPILLSELPLTEQIAILRGADFIIAPHGAGLTNIVFSGKERKLIELMPDNYFNQCFRAIAITKSFDYIGTINPATTDTRGHHYSTTSVDIDILNLAIDEMESL